MILKHEDETNKTHERNGCGDLSEDDDWMATTN
jgi:hypothetical protein